MPLTSIQILWVVTCPEVDVDCASNLGEVLACVIEKRTCASYSVKIIIQLMFIG